MRFLKQYAYNLALSLDQFLNTILLGDPDESISGRCGRAILSNKPKFWVPMLARVIDLFFYVTFNERDHVLNAVEPEETHEKELWSWIENETSNGSGSPT